MHVVFLPGAAGAPEFWHPLGELLPAEWQKTYLSWPGLGNQPHQVDVNGFDDLLRLTLDVIAGSAVVIAQSMGGIVAVKLAARYPDRVSRLVLAATSGGVDIAASELHDWRSGYRKSFPDAKAWITEQRPDCTQDISRISCPTLLLWGDKDPVSPVSVGTRLQGLLQQATLKIIADGNHDLGEKRAAEVAPLVIGFLGQAPQFGI